MILGVVRSMYLCALLPPVLAMLISLPTLFLVIMGAGRGSASGGVPDAICVWWCPRRSLSTASTPCSFDASGERADPGACNAGMVPVATALAATLMESVAAVRMESHGPPVAVGYNQGSGMGRAQNTGGRAGAGAERGTDGTVSTASGNKA